MNKFDWESLDDLNGKNHPGVKGANKLLHCDISDSSVVLNSIGYVTSMYSYSTKDKRYVMFVRLPKGKLVILRLDTLDESLCERILSQPSLKLSELNECGFLVWSWMRGKYEKDKRRSFRKLGASFAQTEIDLDIADGKDIRKKKLSHLGIVHPNIPDTVTYEVK